MLKAEEVNTVYDPSKSLSRRGRKRLIKDGIDEARMLYKLAAANTSHARILLLRSINIVILKAHQSPLYLGKRFKRSYNPHLR